MLKYNENVRLIRIMACESGLLQKDSLNLRWIDDGASY